MADFLMPSLGADMAAATLVAWRVAPGQVVARGDIVAEVETEKGLIDLECFEPGVIEALHVAPGTKVQVGDRMATITPQDGTAVPSPQPPVQATPSSMPPPAPPGPQPLAQEAGRRLRVSPAARARARALGIDLTGASGSGPGGAIEIADITRLAAAPPADQGAAVAPGDALAPMRRAIAAAMSKSKREIPHYYLQSRVDMTAALAWLHRENERRSIADRILPAVVLLKATARALRDVPALNGYWIDGQHQPAERVHLGFAIALRGGGLVAPAIHDVDQKSCDMLMTDLRDLIPRARAGRMRSSEMTDATATVTSMGDAGAESVLGVIYPPQVALIGFGRILEQPWAERGTVVVRSVVTATLAADHRTTDGHLGARFLDALTRHLQTPDTL